MVEGKGLRRMNSLYTVVGLMDGSKYHFDQETKRVELTESWVRVYGGPELKELTLAINSSLVGCVSFNQAGLEGEDGR